MGKHTLKHARKDAAFLSKVVVLTTAAGIPVIGPQISTAIDIWEGERISRRVEDFIEEVNARFSKLEEEKLDRAYINSDAFQDAVISAVQAAKTSSAPSKREWVAGVLIGAITTDRPADLDVEALLDTIAGLTERELAILARVWTIAQNVASEFYSGGLPDFLKGPDYNFHLLRLESAGMITYRADLPVMGSYDRRTFVTTETFRRLMRLIEAAGPAS